MNPQEFEFIRDLVKNAAGMIFAPEKAYLVESRLAPVLQSHQLKSTGDLVVGLQRRESSRLLRAVIDALTINETSFFRDARPFDTLRNYVLPLILQSNSDTKSFRLWCAAASTGQESYSIAMTLAEERSRLNGWSYKIFGTDISPTALKRAVEARYSTFEVSRGLLEPMRSRYFDCVDTNWIAKPAIRMPTTFAEHNLVEDSARLGQFDVVFCRNVLIYFDLPTKRRVVEQIYRRLAPGGHLFLGAAETIIGVSEQFRIVPGKSGLYQKIDTQEACPSKLTSSQMVA